MLGKITNEISVWYKLFVMSLPESSFIGAKLRYAYWARQIRTVGSGLFINRMANLVNAENMDIGNNFLLGAYAIIDANDSNGVFIGNNVGIAKGVYMRASNHKMYRIDVPIFEQGHEAATVAFGDSTYSIVIDDDVWIGAHAILVSGAKIGKGSVISAGALVSNEIPPYSIVAGNPGRVISNRLKKIGENKV